jgi:hypothetical protein
MEKSLKILLDENIPERFRHELNDFDTYTVRYLGWKGLQNGQLLQRMIASDLNVLITFDQKLPYENWIASLPIAVIVVKTQKNKLRELIAKKERIIAILALVSENHVYLVD